VVSTDDCVADVRRHSRVLFSHVPVLTEADEGCGKNVQEGHCVIRENINMIKSNNIGQRLMTVHNDEGLDRKGSINNKAFSRNINLNASELLKLLSQLNNLNQ